MRMTTITASIGLANIRYQGLWILKLDLERGK
jgi:hypothetical protein